MNRDGVVKRIYLRYTYVQCTLYNCTLYNVQCTCTIYKCDWGCGGCEVLDVLSKWLRMQLLGGEGFDSQMGMWLLTAQCLGMCWRTGLGCACYDVRDFLAQWLAQKTIKPVPGLNLAPPPEKQSSVCNVPRILFKLKIFKKTYLTSRPHACRTSCTNIFNLNNFVLYENCLHKLMIKSGSHLLIWIRATQQYSLC